jgi:type I restriction enzyme S subunit
MTKLNSKSVQFYLTHSVAAFLGIDKMYKEFLYFFLQSKSIYFLQEAARGQGQPNLNIDIISYTKLSLPPFAEQKSIVEKVEKLMAICDEMEKEINQNKEYAEQLMQAVLREAFEGE